VFVLKFGIEIVEDGVLSRCWKFSLLTLASFEAVVSRRLKWKTSSMINKSLSSRKQAHFAVIVTPLEKTGGEAHARRDFFWSTPSKDKKKEEQSTRKSEIATPMAF
jgi:hypothetical protein